MFLKEPYTTVEEFYKAVEQLIQALKVSGKTAEASRLDALMHSAWTTGSELIGELMLALAQMRGAFPEGIRKQIRGLPLLCQASQTHTGPGLNQDELDA